MTGSSCTTFSCSTACKNGTHGLKLERAKNTFVEHCLIKSNGKSGIVANPDSCSTAIHSSDILLNIGCGIEISGDKQAKIVGCLIADNMKNGCEISAPFLQIGKNIIANNSKNGIKIKGSGGRIEKNSVFENQKCGIYLSECCHVTENKISKNGRYGIFLAGEKNIVSQNSLADNHTADILRISPINTFSDNSCTHTLPHNL